MRLTRSRKQAIIDGYLNATGRNMFVAPEFIDWLEGQKDHESYPWFFSQTDAEAARQRRVEMARNFVSGLRVVVRGSESGANSKTVRITEKSYPAYVSPQEGRKNGGGYIAFDPENPEHRDMLRGEGAKAMVSWLERYEHVFDDLDLAVMKEISVQQVAHRVEAA